ncbi:hypothetical protein ATO6_12215 [Oceanicola sp. 22II-s10i]|uniref:C4-dicarboxylate TRAP transporter substrate-binding protein n=1 Tax=Oceanicola sp. 22II-s10i TaxID=1317116 RepID=UPI000B7444D4|nr:C4-dicarboxylate TRAP transporter substrate-binding protein [Oceanicola sp. 22II-s10i]OWU84455.1 hypothetical protein ATO6_12215 [Oceanicola sp. 22II-s10i]
MKYLAGALCAVSMCVAAPAMAREITVGAYTSPQSTPNTHGLFPGTKRMTEQSGGELTFELFTGGSMGGPKELLGNVGSGILDAASVVGIYVSSQIPTSSMLSSLLVVGDDPKVMVGAMNEMQLLNCPECKDELERNNVVGLSWTGIAPVHMICRDPISGLADLQGKKVIGPSGLGIALQAIGATPVSITTAEMYEAMNRGQADCSVGSIAWLDTYSLGDFSKGLWDTPLGSYFGVMNWTLNKDLWADLSEKEKQIFHDNLAQQIGDVMWGYEEDDREAIANFEAKNGPATTPDQAFKDAWNEQKAVAVQAAIDKGVKDGVPNAEANVRKFMELAEKWKGIVADGEGSKDHYIAALQREIFDKL